MSLHSVELTPRFWTININFLETNILKEVGPTTLAL